MYGFFPERIYNDIKDEQAFIDVYNAITERKTNIVTLKDMILSDKNMPGVEAVMGNLISLIDTKYPQYSMELKVVFNDISKEELLKMYDQAPDKETKFIILSNVIDQSYKDHMFEDHMRTYIDLYDGMTDEEKKLVSKYVHLKYFTASTFIKFLDTNADENYIKTNLEFIKDKFKYCSTYIDADTLNNVYVEVIDDMIANSLAKLERDDLVLQYLDEVDLGIETLEYQYKDYSYAYARYLDHMFNMFFVMRQFDRAFEILVKNVKYMDNALLDIKKLLRGLNYYDKCSHGRFLVLIRKYIKIIESLDCLEFDFKNLSEEDRALCLEEKLAEESKLPNSPYFYIIQNFINHVDSWIDGNAFMFDVINKIYNIEVKYE